jgi:hypothetical protein
VGHPEGDQQHETTVDELGDEQQRHDGPEMRVAQKRDQRDRGRRRPSLTTWGDVDFAEQKDEHHERQRAHGGGEEKCRARAEV